MSTPQTAKVYPLPVPTGGVNFKDPLAAMDPIYSPWMVNVTPETQYLRVRNGYVRHCTPVAGKNVRGLGVYGRPALTSTYKLFAYVATDTAHSVYNVSTTTAALATTTVAASGTGVSPVSYGTRLAFFSGTQPDQFATAYDGSTWATPGFTYLGGHVTGRVALQFKGRVYIFLTAGQYLYYAETVGAVTGTTRRVDITSLFKHSNRLAWAAALSAPGERAAETYLAIGNDAGEVVVYAGDFPDSSTWALVGTYETAMPMGWQPIISVYNDIYIMTLSGVVSLRDLITHGSRATTELSVSWAINPYWARLMDRLSASAFLTYPVYGRLWPEKNQIYILVPRYIDQAGSLSAGAATMFVYNFLTQAWGIHKIDGIDTDAIGGLTHYDDNLYFFVGDTIMKVDADGFLDEAYDSAGTYQAYDYAIYSAYTNLGSQNKYKKAVGFEPILKTQFASANVTMKGAADFGRRVSDAAVASLQSGYNVPFYGCGVEGAYLQWRIEGTTPDDSNTTGLEVYSVGIAI